MEYQVRAARITDIDRIVALSDGRSLRRDRGLHPAADLLRQLVYLPQASVVVAEMGRELVGSAVLVLRPSIPAGGYVGTIDLLAVGPDHDAERVTTALVDEVVRSARNKGCTVIEVTRPEDPAQRSTLERLGFSRPGHTIERGLGAEGEAARRAT